MRSFLPHVPAIHDQGAQLVFISTGEARYARAFREDYDVTVPIWVDPERTSYKALEFTRSKRATFNLDAVRNGRRAFAAGHRQSATRGDPWQQGGVLIVETDGTVRYRYASASAGDHPDVDAVMAALGGEG